MLCQCVSNPRGSKNLPLMSQVVRLARFETGFVQKSGPNPGGPLRVNP